MQKDRVYMLQQLCNHFKNYCYHFRDNHQTVIAEALREAAYYGGAWSSGELFESEFLSFVEPLITRLCPLSVLKHEFIIHSCFTTINR